MIGTTKPTPMNGWSVETLAISNRFSSLRCVDTASTQRSIFILFIVDVSGKPRMFLHKDALTSDHYLGIEAFFQYDSVSTVSFPRTIARMANLMRGLKSLEPLGRSL